MLRKGLLRALLIYAGICGFVMVSLGIVLLVLQYQAVYITISLIVFGMVQLIFFCHPNAEGGALFFYIVQNAMMAALMIFGLTTFFYSEATVRMIGIACFCMGLIMGMANNLFLLYTVILREKEENVINEAIYNEIKEAIVEELKSAQINMPDPWQKTKIH